MRQTSLGFVIVAALSAGPGCVCVYPKSVALPADCTAACADVPCACRGKVYVFLLSGLDLFDTDRVADFRQSLIQAGFTKVYSGQFYHDSFFASEMHRLALAEPDARFVLIGFSLGADEAVSLAESVANYHVPITLLATVDPYVWSPAPARQPANVQQVMHVHGESLLLPGRMSAGSDVQIPETFPANITAHPLTVEQLARALAGIAGTLPAPEQKPAPPIVETTPTPRPVANRGDRPNDAWDFLRPVASLKSLSPIEPAIEPVRPGERTTLRPAQPRVPG